MAKEEQHLVTNNLLINNNSNNNNSMSCLTPLRNCLTNNKELSQLSNRISLKKLSTEKRAKRIKFYLNGDKFFKGLVYAFNWDKIRTFDAICEDLTRVLGHNIRLPSGVRFIYSIDGTEKVSSLEQLHEGMSYVCSSADNYIRLDYESVNNMNSVWNDSSVNLKNVHNVKKTFNENNNNNNNSQQLNLVEPNQHQTSSLSSSSSASPTPKAPDFIRPKLVTVIRNGVKPRKAVRILLNRKTAQTYDQVLSEITNAIKLDCGAVRKIYTLGGKQVSCLADFFSDDEVFIAYGLEKYSHEDLDLDSEEYKYLNSKTSSLSRSACNRTSRKVLSPLSVIYGSGCLTNGKGINLSSNQNSPKITKSNDKNDKNTKNVALNDYNFNGNGYSVCILFPKEVVQHYEIGQIIGDGNFAVVHECVHKTTRIQFALKIIDKSKCKGKEAMIASEVAILRKVKHHNIIQLIEDFDYTNELYLVMELVKGGDLFDAITLANKYTEKDATQMIYNLCDALSYLHSLNIVHRDVKPENLLICEHSDGSKTLKLGDFGLAVEIEDHQKLYSVCGTPTYVAPEILSESGYDKEVDIWAAGVIAYILLCGFPPFANEDNDQDLLFDQILSGSFEFTKPFWDCVSQSAKELITYMLEVDPTKRYTAYQVMQHQWVAGETAGTNDMLISVSQKLSLHFDKKSNNKKNNCSNNMGISLIAVST